MSEQTAEPTVRGYVGRLFRSTRAHWEAQDVLAGVVIALLGVIGWSKWTTDATVTEMVTASALWSAAVVFFIVSPWRLWRDSQRQLIDHEERLRPKLVFVHRPLERPYVEEFRVRERGRLARLLQMSRIGLRNDSTAVIAGVRVVVESSSLVRGGKAVAPSPRSPVTLGRALNISGIDTPDGSFSLAPGDTPAAYVDVAERTIITEKVTRDEDAKWFSLCYASRARSAMSIDSEWTIGLRADGGGTSARIKVRFTFDEVNNRLVMAVVENG